MSWLRTDDGFPQHPKFEGWTPLQKWSFLELMHYCARYRTKGRVPTDLTLLPRSVTPALIALAHHSEWLDQDENGVYWIHDWSIYNPADETNAERQRRYRDRNKTVTPAVTPTVTKPLPRARASAAVPVPSPSIDQQAALETTRDASPAASNGAAAADLLTLLTAAKWTGPDLHTAEPDRALAWLRRGLSSPSVQNVAGFYRRGMEQAGVWPEPVAGEQPARPTLPLFTILTTWIRTVGHTDHWAGVEREISDREHHRGEKITDAERLECHELWQSLQPDDPGEPDPPVTPQDGGQLPTVDMPGIDGDRGQAA